MNTRKIKASKDAYLLGMSLPIFFEPKVLDVLPNYSMLLMLIFPIFPHSQLKENKFKSNLKISNNLKTLYISGPAGDA